MRVHKRPRIGDVFGGLESLGSLQSKERIKVMLTDGALELNADLISEALKDFSSEEKKELLVDSDLMPQVPVRLYWQLSEMGFLSFDEYIIRCCVNALVEYFRVEVMIPRMEMEDAEEEESNGRELFAASEADILLTLLSFAYGSQYSSSDSSSLRLKTRTILQLMLGIHRSLLTSLDIFIIDYVLDLSGLHEDEGVGNALQSDVLKSFVSGHCAYSAGMTSSAAHSRLWSLLARFTTEDLKRSLTSCLLRRDPIALDDLTPSSNSTRLSLTLIMEILEKRISLLPLIGILVQVVSLSVRDAFALGILRSAALLQLIENYSNKFQSGMSLFASKLIRGNIGALGTDIIPAMAAAESDSSPFLTNKSFGFICLSLLEAIPLLSIENCKLLSVAIASHRSINLEASEVFLRTARSHQQQQTSLLSKLFAGIAPPYYNNFLYNCSPFRQRIRLLSSLRCINSRAGLALFFALGSYRWRSPNSASCRVRTDTKVS